MAYGTIKVDTITFTDSGVDKSVSISGLVQNPTFSGNITVTGTVSGNTIQGQTVSGVTVTGTTASFTSGNFTTFTGGTITLTSGVIASGTAANPSLSILGDANTGLYSPGADQLAISTAGSGRLFVDASGNVGIGQSSVAAVFGRTVSNTGADAATYRVAGASTSAYIFTSDALGYGGIYQETNHPFIIGTNSTERLRITSAGLMGVGTSAPGSIFEAKGNSPQLFVNSTTASYPGLVFQTNGVSDGAVLYNGIYDRLEFYTADTSGNPQVIIDASGRLGVGTTSPGYALDIQGSQGVGLQIYETSSGINRRLQITQQASGVTYNATWNSGDNAHVWQIGNSEVARIDSSGRLGVGTTSPTYSLVVSAAGASGIELGPAYSGTANLVQHYSRSGSVYVDAVNDAAQHRFQTSGSEKARITSAGLVGVGVSDPIEKLVVAGATANIGIYNTTAGSTASPSYSRLNFYGYLQTALWNVASISAGNSASNTYGGILQFATNTAGGTHTTALTIDSQQQVGIGTTSPITKLDVRSGVITAGSASSPNGTEILRGYYSDTEGALAVIGTERSSGGIVIGYGVKPSTSSSGAFLSATSITIGRGAYTIADNIHKWYTGATQTVAENSSVSTSEVMRIDSNGRLGIGTSSPDDSLHLASGNFRLTNGAAFTSTNSIIRIISSYAGSANQFETTRISAITGAFVNRGEIAFNTGDDTNTCVERLRIDYLGRVGIGNNAPSYELDLGKDSAVQNYTQRIISGGSYSAASRYDLNGIGTFTVGFNNSGGIVNNAPNGAASLWMQQTYPIVFGTNGSERLRIDSSGRLLVGTSSAETWYSSKVQVQASGTEASITAIGNSNDSSGSFIFLGKSRGSSANAVTIVQNNDNLGQIYFLGADGTDTRTIGAGIFAQVDGTPGVDDLPTRLVFSTTADGASSPTERMRITNGGRILLTTTVESSLEAVDVNVGQRLSLCINATDSADRRNWRLQTETDALGDLCFRCSTTNTGGPTTTRVQFTSAGQAYNTTGTWGTLSDANLKQEIEDASSQWDDIKAVRFRKYRLKDEVINNENASHHLGVIAQELEQTSPGLVVDSENGVKSVKQSILLMKAAKALQEAMERIETLEQRLNDAGIN